MSLLALLIYLPIFVLPPRGARMGKEETGQGRRWGAVNVRRLSLCRCDERQKIGHYKCRASDKDCIISLASFLAAIKAASTVG